MNIFEKFLSLNLSCIPCNGKICALPSWKPYQEKIADIAEAQTWTGNVALICGKVSGGLTCLDFDVKNGDRFNPWMEIMAIQAPETLSKLLIEQTPSGGKHVIFKSSTEIKNVKLACPPREPQLLKHRQEVLSQL